VYPNIDTLDQLIGRDLYFLPFNTSTISGDDLSTAMEKESLLNEDRLRFIQRCMPCFRELCKENIYACDENNTIPLDFVSLKSFVFKQDDGFERMIFDRPQFVFDCIGVVLYQILYQNTAMSLATKKKVNVRIFNYPSCYIRTLKSNLIGKLVAIKGTVIRVGNVRPFVKSMSYKCPLCSTVQLKYFNEGRTSMPTSCVGYDCPSKSFEPLRSTAVTVDWQKIRLQEDADQKDQKSGIPKNIECELTEDLVETVVPGDIVTVCGIIKVLKQEEGGNSSSNKAIYFMYLDANSIDSNKQVDSAGKADITNFSIKDMYGIKSIAEQPNLFKLIVNSICPSIYGQEMVKAGLSLALFGGNPRNLQDKNRLPIRGDPHVLIVGDPGLGKSQMLKAFQTISPRGVYVSGGYTTTTGLTVSLHRESGSGDFALEAGALVLGDQGCCCIDEFDKMKKEHPALLEAMEQQSVSIAKAGIVCNLPARTSVIAAANPVGGHYNRAKTVSENIKMSSPLLSRFDLIFVLLDKPNEGMDRIISHHILDVILHRLILQSGEEFDAIAPLILRKYISYAKKYVFPVLSEDAIKVIQEFYLDLRDRSTKQDSAPVTTRQLESLIRLSEARAKLELREEVTKDDALDVVEIMKESIMEVFEDEYGKVDFRRTSRMGKSSMVKKVSALLSKECNKTGVDEYTDNQIYKLMKDNKMPLENFTEILETLNHQGFVLKKGGKYKVQS
ncbi:hypothetical protein SAMD00019534_079030, partial [Acytostelium subglobosum LB1]|uniref:hypothetical protein n=1 Tax=Acytostelium subglobosum LB1 TaxID=1410327 RepID=UPI000644B978